MTIELIRRIPAITAAAVMSAALMLAGMQGHVPVTSAAPDEDQIFFDDLAQQGLRPDYDKQVCGSIKCEPLRELLVQEGHATCTALGTGAAPLVPFSVIENLNISPGQAEAFIVASRQAYCPQAPDPYSRPN